MASRNPAGGAFLPRTFRCRVCGQNKTPAAFSKSQLQKWYNKKRNDRRNEVTPDSIGLSCKDHNNEDREIRCHGPCDRVKVVGQFSKAQRNNLEPWCITCTEWRLNFDGTESAADVPNDLSAHHGDEGVRDNEGFARGPSSFDEEDDEDDEDDDGAFAYDQPTLVTSFVDRLEGYGDDEVASEDLTTDAVSTTNDMQISLWNDDTTDGRSDSGSVMQPIATQGGRSFANVAITSKPGRYPSNSQGYTATASSTASLSAATTPFDVGQLTILASALDIGHQTLKNQDSRSMGMGENTQALSSRFPTAPSTPRQVSAVGDGGRALATAKKPARPVNPNGCNQIKENQKPRKGNNDKWYKGDNRKVFPGNSFAIRPEDGTEAAHDSDSPDEM